ncbi:MAG: hypothetical protein Q8Q25_01455 [bacterium]|nr:hypothetical protein [bacterium]
MIEPHLYDYHYWIAARPLPLSTRGISILLFVFASMIVFDIVLRIIAKKKKRQWDSLTKKVVVRVHSYLNTMTVFGLILLFFAYQGIAVLGARYLLLLWGLGMLVWGLTIMHDIYVRNPGLRTAAIKKGEFTKYLRKK